jgi:Protein of unknown function (DUF3618)
MTESGLTPAGPGPGDAPPDGIQALTEEIERTREDVGETVAALAAKADVIARVREEASEVAGRLRDAAGKVKEQIMAVPRQRRAVHGSVHGPARRCPDRAPPPTRSHAVTGRVSPSPQADLMIQDSQMPERRPIRRAS